MSDNFHEKCEKVLNCKILYKRGDENSVHVVNGTYILCKLAKERVKNIKKIAVTALVTQINM
jgi:hypothetical protein